MPIPWLNNKMAVTLEELVPTWWLTYNSLKLEIWRYKDKPYGIKRLQVGGNGRQLLVDFDSLPREIQDAIGDPRKKQHALEPYFEMDMQAAIFYSTFIRKGFGNLKPQEQERYVLNASVLNAAMKLEKARSIERRNLNGSMRGLVNSIYEDVVSFNDLLKKQRKPLHKLPTNLRRFKETYSIYKDEEQGGYYSLIRDPEGKTLKNAEKADEKVLAIVRGLFTQQDWKPNPTDIAREYEKFKTGDAEVYNKATGEIYNPNDYPELSKNTIRQVIAKWEFAVADEEKRAGNRQHYINKRIPARQYEKPVFAGTIISIDDRQPPFWYESGKRPWFYIAYDVASECFTTFVHGKQKKGIIIEFYRQLVRDYADWGVRLPYELECESSLNSSFTETFLAEGQMFGRVKMVANISRGKMIENRFRALRYGEEKKEKGWRPRPFARLEANQDRLEKSKQDEIIIPYEKIVEDRMKEIEDWNNSPHSSGCGLSRWEYFLQNQHEDLSPVNYQSILPHLGHYTASSCHTGYITLQGQKRAIAQYGEIVTGENLIGVMRQIEGKDVDVYWLDDHEGNVLKAHVMYKGRFVCELLPMPKPVRGHLEFTDADREADALQARYVNTIRGFAAQQKEWVDTEVGYTDKTPRPERKFKMRGLERFQPRPEDEPVQEIEDHEKQIVYKHNSNNGTSDAGASAAFKI